MQAIQSRAHSATVTGLTNGNAYQFRVNATNIAGTGPASNTASTTPTAPVVPDTTPPTISITTPSLVRVEAGGTYTEPGAICQDNIDPNKAATVGGETVDPSTLGTYVVTYDCTDAANNAATQVSRSVEVTDTTAPVITLTGAATVSVQRGATYTDASATCTDSFDTTPTLTDDSSSVDTSVVQDYTVTYSCRDDSNNVAAQIQRTVKVYTTPDAPTGLTATAGNARAELAWSAPENDGNSEITGYAVEYKQSSAASWTAFAGNPVTSTTSATVTGLTNGNAYQFRVNATNIAGTGPASNTASTTPTAPVVPDTTPPTISITTPSLVRVEAGGTYTEPGAICQDNIDPNKAATVGGETVDPSTLGTYVVTYDCTDAANNAATQVSRSVEVTDTTAPVITLTGAATVSVQRGATYTDASATCTDSFDTAPTLTDDSSSVDTSVVQDYTVTYSCRDDSNNVAAQIQRTVKVYTTPDAPTGLTATAGNARAELAWSAPENDGNSEITGYAVEYKQSSAASWTAFAGNPVTSTTSATVTGLTNGNAYQFRVNATNIAGTGPASNTASTTPTAPVVPDTTPPTISITTPSLVRVEAGGTYTEPGAICQDNIDPNKAATVGGETVDPSTLGTYVVTYDCTDAANNAATQVSRSVEVTDTTAPVITLTGAATVSVQRGATYTDASATCTDSFDTTPTLTDDSSSVDTSVVQDYTVTYSCRDDSNNVAAQIQRTVKVYTTPDAPTGLTATAGNARAELAWSAPENDGNSEITGYAVEYKQSSAASWTAFAGNPVTSTTSATVTGLTNGNAYQFRVNATNIAGTGPASNTASTTPTAPVVPDTTPPTISITTPSLVRVEAGGTYTEPGAICQDNIDPNKAATVGGETVDPSTLGTYVVTYDCTDAANNAATQVSRSVEVTDTTAPVITLTGAATVSVQRGATYTDASATCTDSFDTAPTLTDDSSSVDTSVVQDYTVTYSCRDDSNNVAAQIQRTVKVYTTPDAPTGLTATAGNARAELAWSAPENDGNSEITGYAVEYKQSSAASWTAFAGNPVTSTTSATVTGLTNGNAYQFRVNATNIAGTGPTSNVASATPTAPVVPDTTPPTISITTPSLVRVEAGGTYTEPGAICQDNIDPNKAATVGGETVDPSTLGTYVVTYDCTDAANNAATQVSRSVEVTDTTAPVITLTGAATVSVQRGATYTDASATCTDSFDTTPTLTDDSSSVDTSVVQDYTVTYSCRDDSNNVAAQIQRTVKVYTTPDAPTGLTATAGNARAELAWSAPENDGNSEITGYAVEYKQSSAASWTAFAGNPVTSTTSATVTGLTNGNAYQFRVNATNIAGTGPTSNVASATPTAPVVPDTTPPTISITTPSLVRVEAGGTYTEPGAICQDNIDPNKAATVGGETVDPSTLGTYVVTYDCTDAANNAATQVSRSVEVTDTTAPVITLTGAATVSVQRGATYTDASATCTDSFDTAPTLTDDSSSVDTSVVQDYTVTYSCRDDSNNVAAQIQRTVKVYTTPDAPTGLTATAGNARAELAWSAPENDGNSEITGYAVEYKQSSAASWTAFAGNPVTSTTSATVTGLTNGNAYQFRVNATNIAGTGPTSNVASATPTAPVVPDTTPPTISITTPSLVRVEAGGTYTEPGAICQDNIDPNKAATVGGETVDPSTLGTYVVTYDCTDAANNAATQVSRSVEVTDTTAPVITLTGAATVSVQRGATYTDASATCTDSFDTAPTLTDDSSSVDTSVVQDYTVTYSCRDDSNNVAAQIQRTVKVYTTPDAPTGLTATAGNARAELAWSAPENDGNSEITGYAVEYKQSSAASWTAFAGNPVTSTTSATVTGLTNGNAYQFRVNATNIAGTGPASNTASTTPTAPVVPDTTPPTISITTPSLVRVEAGGTYTEPGAICQDNIDPNKAATVGGETVDPSTLGTYVVTYDCTDAANNAATQVSRSVEVTDTTAPVITLTGAATVSVQRGATYTDASATCTDSFDTAPTLTDDSSSVDTSVVQDYTVTYSCRDDSNNVAAQIQRTVKVYTTPDAPTGLTATAGNARAELAWSAPENDGNSEITGYAVEYKQSSAASWTAFAGNPVTSTTSATVTGLTNGNAYQFRVNATNIAGTGPTSNVASATPTAPVVPDTTPPTISITTPSLVRVEAGGTYTEPGAICQDNIDPNKAATVGGETVDPSTLGTYVVTYDCTDAANNAATQVSRSVEVTDTTAPVITLTGAATVSVQRGATYTDASATCTDSFDTAPTLTDDSSSVDTSVVQDYTVTYSCRDDSNNVAAQIQRTVKVYTTPDAPTGLTATAGNARAELAWSAPENDGNSEITGYAVEYKQSSAASWTAFAGNPVTSTTSATVTGLTNGNAYQFRVNATNIAGTGPASNTASTTPILTGTDQDTEPPVVISAEMNLHPEIRTLTITFDGPVDISAINLSEIYITEGTDPTASITPTVAGSQRTLFTAGVWHAQGVNISLPTIKHATWEASQGPGVRYVQSAGLPDVVLTGATIVTVEDGPVVVINLTGPQAAVIQNMTSPLLRVESGAFVDIVGNEISATSQIVVQDLAPPIVLSARLNLDHNNRTLEITFDEHVDVSATNPAKLSVSHTDGSGGVGLAGAMVVTTEDDSRILIIITEQQRADIEALSSHLLAVGAGAFSDTAGNLINAVAYGDIVIVSAPDTTPPIISLVGPQDVTVTRGQSYADEGAICTDETDGSINPVVSNPVDTSVSGTYVITYSCTDTAGNEADGAKRTVRVSDEPRQDSRDGARSSGGGGGGGGDGGRSVLTLSPIAVAYDLCGPERYLALLAATYGDNLSSSITYDNTTTPGSDITNFVNLDEHILSSVPVNLYVFVYAGLPADTTSFEISIRDRSGKEVNTPLLLTSDQCSDVIRFADIHSRVLPGINVRDSLVDILPNIDTRDMSQEDTPASASDSTQDGLDDMEHTPDTTIVDPQATPDVTPTPKGTESISPPDADDSERVYTPPAPDTDIRDSPTRQVPDAPTRQVPDVPTSDDVPYESIGPSESGDTDDAKHTIYDGVVSILPDVILEKLLQSIFDVSSEIDDGTYGTSDSVYDGPAIVTPSPAESSDSTTTENTPLVVIPADDNNTSGNITSPDTELTSPEIPPTLDNPQQNQNTTTTTTTTTTTPAETPLPADNNVPESSLRTPLPADEQPHHTQNHNPVLEHVPPRNATLGVPVTVHLDAYDADGDKLKFSTNMTDAWMSPDTGRFTWMPHASDFGMNYVEMSVSDPAGGTDTVTLIVNVTTIQNTSPKFDPLDHVVVSEHIPLRLDLAATDADGDVLVYSFAKYDSPPENATLDPDTGVFEWTPGETQQGVHVFSILVSDHRADPVRQTVSIEVAESNEPPVLLLPIEQDIKVTVGKMFEIDLDVVDLDQPIDKLVFSTNMTDATFDSDTGKLVWLPHGRDIGEHYVWFGVHDNRGGEDEAIILIVVTATSTVG